MSRTSQQKVCLAEGCDISGSRGSFKGLQLVIPPSRTWIFKDQKKKNHARPPDRLHQEKKTLPGMTNLLWSNSLPAALDYANMSAGFAPSTCIFVLRKVTFHLLTLTSTVSTWRAQ